MATTTDPVRFKAHPSDNNAVIGRIIAKHVPAGWCRAWISAIADDGYIGKLTSDCIAADGTETWFDIADTGDVFELSNALLALREDLRQEESGGFSRCTFSVTPEGDFKLDAGYDD